MFNLECWFFLHNLAFIRDQGQPTKTFKLQAIAKRVNTLPVIGYVLDTHHCIACLPPSLPYQCCTKFAMTFNQASLNIERGGGGLGCSMAFYSVLFAGNRKNAESVSSILQLLVADS